MRRARRPERQLDTRAFRVAGVSRANSRWPLLQVDAVDVDVVVPVVERRVDRPRQRRQRVRPEAGVVVRLVVVGGGSGVPSVSSVERGEHVERPQPVNGSRPGGHAAQPVAAFASSALRSSSHATCSGASLGSWPSRSAAAAETCGAANDVPIASRNSNGPQSEYGWSAQPARRSTSCRGIVEKIASPGAARSL